MVSVLGVVLATVAAGATATHPASQAELAEVTPFGEDPRLDRELTLARQDVPLGELLPEVGRVIGVRLSAGTATADDRVTVFLDRRPAREVLARIARHFEFEWRREATGYRLIRSSIAARREEELRQADRRAQIARRIHDRMRRLARLAQTPQKRLEERHDEVCRLLAGPAPPPAKRARLEDERAALSDVLHTPTALALAAYARLSPAQLQRLAARGELRLTSQDGSLARDLALVVHEQVEEWGPAEDPTPWSRLPPYRAEIAFSLSDTPRDYGPATRDRPEVCLGAELVGVRGSLRERWRWAAYAGPERPQPDLPPVRTTTTDPRLLREAELTWPPGGRVAGRAAPAGTDRWPAGMATVGDLAWALHRAAGLEVLADSFTHARLDPSLLAGRQPVARLLDRVATEMEYDWRFEEGVLLLRNRRWYRDRPEEVPERVLRPWREQVRQMRWQGLEALHHLSRLAAALPDPQARGLDRGWGWYLEGTGIPIPSSDQSWGGFHRFRQPLRLWSLLAPAQREAALAGAALPVPGMTPAQRRAFLAAMLYEDPEFPVREGSPAPAEVAAGALRIRGFAFRRQRYDPDEPGADGYTVVTEGLDLDNRMVWRIKPDGHPVGPPTLGHSFSFSYFLGGREEPAAAVKLEVPWGVGLRELGEVGR